MTGVTADVFPDAHTDARGSGADPDCDVVASPKHPLPNARRFITDRFEHREHPLLVCQGGAWFAWDGRCWPELNHDALKAAVYDRFEHTTFVNDKGVEEEFRPTRYKVADLVDALRAITHLAGDVAPPAWLDDDGAVPAAELVACANGLVHIGTRELHPLTPRFYVHHSVPFAYDPDAPAPVKWFEFLDDLWPADQQTKNTLQETFGYLIGGGTEQQKIFLLVGPKRSGKGTIARVLTALVGRHHVAAPTVASLGTNFGLQPLIGKPVAVVSDARLGRHNRDQAVITERLLSISGEDSLTIDRKYRDPWTGRLPTRFVILTNELPELTDSSGALASRFVVLLTTRSFYGRENTMLTDELLAELPGIFNWSLDGLERLRGRDRFEQPSSSLEAIRELEDLGSPISAFIRDRCEIGPGFAVAVDSMWTEWKTWCDDHGRRSGTKQVFGRNLRASVPGLHVTQPRDGEARYRRYEGVRLRQENIAPGRVPPRAIDPGLAMARDGTQSNPLFSQHEHAAGTDGRLNGSNCVVCRLPLDRVLVEMGRTTHHPCEELP